MWGPINAAAWTKFGAAGRPEVSGHFGGRAISKREQAETWESRAFHFFRWSHPAMLELELQLGEIWSKLDSRTAGMNAGGASARYKRDSAHSPETSTPTKPKKV